MIEIIGTIFIATLITMFGVLSAYVNLSIPKGSKHLQTLDLERQKAFKHNIYEHMAIDIKLNQLYKEMDNE